FPRRVNRSPSTTGPSSTMDSGSTMMSSAALVAVDRAIPQWLNAKAPAKPNTPIHTMRQASLPDGGGTGGDHAGLNGTRIAAPSTSLSSASSAGGTSSSTTRVAT